MSKRKTRAVQCELTTNPAKRAAADALAASVKDQLPTGLSQPALRALAGARLTRLEDFTRVTETEVLKLHGMGPKAMGILRDALKANKLAFKQ